MPRRRENEEFTMANYRNNLNEIRSGVRRRNRRNFGEYLRNINPFRGNRVREELPIAIPIATPAYPDNIYERARNITPYLPEGYVFHRNILQDANDGSIIRRARAKYAPPIADAFYI